MATNDNEHQNIETSTDHLTDDEETLERLEMLRMQLPISFGKSPKKRIRRSSRKTKAVEKQTSDNFQSLSPQNDEDTVEEVMTIKMATDPYDCMKMDQVQINTPINNESGDSGSKGTKQIKESTADVDTTAKHDIVTRKYWSQRHLLFKKFSKGIQLDHESWYSVTPEPIAQHIAQRVGQALIKRNVTINNNKYDINAAQCINRFIILDGFCGAGGNTIQFALLPTTAVVFAVDIDPAKVAMARHNARIYGCEHKIQFITEDFFHFIQSGRIPPDLIDVCFLSPPWGGPNYLRKPKYSLNSMSPNGFQIARQVSIHVTKNISFLLPRNFDMEELEPLTRIVYQSNGVSFSQKNSDIDEKLSNLSSSDKPDQIRVEVEENLLLQKVKTMTAYFGDLVDSEGNEFSI